MSVGERKYCPDGKNGGDDKSGSMVNGKKCESKDSKKPEESNLSTLAPAGLSRVGCRVPACGLWSALDHAPECPESHTEGLVGMAGISVP